jgi:Protein of unknown function (DUF5661)
MNIPEMYNQRGSTACMHRDRHPRLNRTESGESDNRRDCFNPEAGRREALAISSEDFRDGLEAELEHGLAFSDANVTNNHPILTGKIVLAHLKETLDYYVRLRVAEIEGDMLKASSAKDSEKLTQKYRLWAAAKADLADRERDQSRKT